MAKRRAALDAVEDTLDKVGGQVVPGLGALGEVHRDVLRGAGHRPVEGQRAQAGARLGAKELDLQAVGLVAGPERLDLQPRARLEADEPSVVRGVCR